MVDAANNLVSLLSLDDSMELPADEFREIGRLLEQESLRRLAEF